MKYGENKTKEIREQMESVANYPGSWNVCPMCGSDKVTIVDYRDELSVKEAKISGLCQKCQDDIFD